MGASGELRLASTSVMADSVRFLVFVVNGFQLVPILSFDLHVILSLHQSGILLKITFLNRTNCQLVPYF